MTVTNGTAAAPEGTPRTKICVFCGSAAGNNPKYIEAARALGRALAERNIDLVYGGGTVGLMGEVAKAVCEINGPDAVHGIIPAALAKFERDDTYQSKNDDNLYIPERSKYGRTTVVQDMHTRKRMMADEVLAGGPGSGFIGLPGGYGTMEELFEVITWNQLGIHNRGVCLLNIEGYWDGIIQWVATAGKQGFVRPANMDIIATADDAEGAIAALSDYKVSEGTFKLDWGKH